MHGRLRARGGGMVCLVAIWLLMSNCRRASDDNEIDTPTGHGGGSGGAVGPSGGGDGGSSAGGSVGGGLDAGAGGATGELDGSASTGDGPAGGRLDGPPSGGGGAPGGPAAVAVLQPLAGNSASGEARFTSSGAAVTVTVHLENAAPGLHGLAIHDKGNCAAGADGLPGGAAGDHWNPTGMMHGRFGTGSFHLGDLGNIEIGDDGTGTFTLTSDRWTMGTGGASDVVGHSVLLHFGPDDFTTQPSGGEGFGSACGVIAK